MNSLPTFLLAIILALATIPAPQSPKKSPPEAKTECGTTLSPEQIQAELTRSAEFASNRSAALAPNTAAPYYLPLTIHMVRDTSGIQVGLSPQDLEASMQTLNQMWQPMGIQFFIYGQIDESILNDDFYNLPNTRASHDALRKVNNVPNTINVYFTNLRGNVSGVGTFTQDSTQGILLDYTTMIEYSPKLYRREVFAHEMGHYFDLYHTHETWPDSNGNPTKVECPSGNNCTTAGDLLCDTPADPGLNEIGLVGDDCAYINGPAPPASCDDTPYRPSTRNLMSYARGFCRTEFTRDQTTRVLEVLNNADNRKNLINSGKRFVDPLAGQSNSSCTYTAPCRTLTKALQDARNGELIFLKPGIHPASDLGSKRVTYKRWGTSGMAELRP